MRATLMRARSELSSGLRSLVALTLILGLAGGVVLFAAAGARRTNSAYPRLVRWANGPDTVVSAGGFGFSPVNLDRVAKLPGVAASALVYQVGFYPATPSGRLVYAGGGAGFAPATGRDLRLLGRPKVLEGRLADPNRPDEIDVGFASTGVANIHAGMHLVLHFYRPGVNVLDFYRGEFPIALARIPKSAFAFSLPVTVAAVTVSPGDFPQIGPFGDVTFMPAFYRTYGRRVFGQPNLAVRLSRGGAGFPAFQRAVSAISSGGNPGMSPVLATVAPIQRSIHPEAIALWMFAALAMVAGALVFAQALARQTFLDSSENPTLRWLGMTGEQMFWVAMIRAALVGAIAAAGAVAIAILLSPLMPLGISKVAEPHTGFSFDWTVLGFGALGIIGASLAVGAIPAWRAARVRGGALGVAEVAEHSHPSAAASAAARTSLPPSAVTGVRMALEPGRGRTATPVRSALVGTAFAIAALTTAFGFAASFDHLFRTPRLSGWNWDVAAGVPFTGDLSRQVVPGLRSSPVVAGLSSVNDSATVDLRSEGGHVTTGALAVERVRGDVHPTILSGWWPRSADEIALGKATLRSLHASIGQRVMVATAARHASMRIVGTAAFINATGTSTSPGDGAGMTVSGLLRLLPRSAVPLNVFLVDFAHGVSVEEGRAAIGPILERAKTSYISVDEAGGIGDLDPVRKLPLVLAGLLALAAAATLAHSLLTSIRRRRRDLAILKTIGFVRRQVSATVAWQATTMAAAALVIGLPVGIAAGRWAWTLFADQLGVASEPLIGAVEVLLAIPATLAVANLLAVIPGRVAARTEPAIVLRSE